jgi:hypothetical protein
MPKMSVIVAIVLATSCKAKEENGAALASETAAPVNAAARPEGTLIPRTVEGDKGRYYLLDAKRAGDVVTALHKRVGIDGVGWTRTETNCKTMRMRELGYSEDSVEAITREPTKWFELVDGSSKSDLANFVCAP